MKTTITQTPAGKAVVTLTTRTRRLAPDFPGWDHPNYGDYLLDIPAGLRGTITGVESHGSNPWTRYTVQFEDGSRASGLVLGVDITTAPAATYTTQIIQPGEEGLFEQVDADGTLACTVCGSVDNVEAQNHPSMCAGGTETSVTCRVCGSSEADSDPFQGTRRVARRDDPRTLADIEHGYDNEGWFGYGYLIRRSQALHSDDPEVPAQPERVTEADTWLLTEANRQGWTAQEMFDWLNSKPGRVYGDLWFGGTLSTDHPVEQQSRGLVRRVRV